MPNFSSYDPWRDQMLDTLRKAGQPDEDQQMVNRLYDEAYGPAVDRMSKAYNKRYWRDAYERGLTPEERNTLRPPQEPGLLEKIGNMFAPALTDQITTGGLNEPDKSQVLGDIVSFLDFPEAGPAKVASTGLKEALPYLSALMWRKMHPNAFMFRGMPNRSTKNEIKLLKKILEQPEGLSTYTEMPSSLITPSVLSSIYPEGMLLNAPTRQHYGQVSFADMYSDLLNTSPLFKEGEERLARRWGKQVKKVPTRLSQGYLSGPSRHSLPDFFQAQLEKMTETSANPGLNEIIARFPFRANPKEQLAGIRINPKKPNKDLLALAEQYEIPLFHWPQAIGRGSASIDAIKRGLQNPLQGDWVREDIKGLPAFTSSEIERLFSDLPKKYDWGGLE